MLKTIQIDTLISEDRVLKLILPADVMPGSHRIIVIIEEAFAPAPPGRQLIMPTFDVGELKDQFQLRREDMYDDTGR